MNKKITQLTPITSLTGDDLFVVVSDNAPGVTSSIDWDNLVASLTLDADQVDDSSSTHKFMTAGEKSKLLGIAAGAEVNVNADWNSGSGDSQILNKPTLGTAAAADSIDFATASQGSLADSALQSGDNISELTNDSGFTTNTGTVTSVSGGTGLAGTVTSSGSISLDSASIASLGKADSALQNVTGLITDGTNVTITGTGTSGDPYVISSSGGGGGGGGDISGGIAAGQVAFGTATDTIGGDDDLFWDDSNKRLGVGTDEPDYDLDVVGDFQVQGSSKSYRFKTSGGALDFDASGTSLYISVYSAADYGGTQRKYLVAKHDNHIIQALGAWEYKASNNEFGDTFAWIGEDKFVFNESGADIDFRIEGDTDTDLFFLDAGNDIVQIGKLSVNGAYTLPTADGTSGQVLQTDGSGAVTWETVSGGGSTVQAFVAIGFSEANYIVDGTDDNVQIQAAIDAVVLAGGGVVYLKEGTYDIAAPIEIEDSNIVLAGGGWSTILKAADDLDDNIIEISGTGTVGVQVVNLAIDGNKDNQASGYGIVINTPYDTTDTHHLLRQLDIRSVIGEGINIAGDTRVVFIEDVRVRNANGTGYNLSGSDHILNNVIADDCAGGGFNISTGSIQAFNSKAFFCGSTGGVGWYIAGARGKYLNCSAQDNYAAGFLVDGTSNCSFVNCTGDSNGRENEWQAGLQINNSDTIIVNGGIFIDRDTGATYRQAFGVSLTGTSDNCVTTYPVFDGNIAANYNDESSGTNRLVQAEANGVSYVNHGATSGTTRPSVSGAVMWIGTVEPSNAVNGDSWLDIS